MRETKKVVHIRKYKTKRRMATIKQNLASPTGLMLVSLLLFFGVGSIIFSADTTIYPDHGFKAAKASLMNYEPEKIHKKS